MSETVRITLMTGLAVGLLATLFRHADDMPTRVAWCCGLGLIGMFVFLGAAGWF
jgi:xanthosine utilization system XapX-like protein